MDSKEWAQANWQQSVEQAIEDIRLLVDSTNDLLRRVSDAERDTAAVQYHVFPSDVDADELVRVAGNLKHDVSQKVARMRDAISDLLTESAELGELARMHQSTM